MSFSRSEEFKDIAAALCEAQGEFEIARKDSLNPHLKSSYADITSIRKASQTALTKYKLALVQTHRLVEGELQQPRHVLVTTLIHAPSGQWFQMEYPLHVLKNDAQGFAAATTYARRVSWATLLGIVAEEEDDDGNTNTEVERNALGQPIGREADQQIEMERRAKAWAEKAIAAVRRLNAEDLDSFMAKNETAISRLKTQNPQWHEDFIAAVAERRLGLKPLNIDAGPKPEPTADEQVQKTVSKFQKLLDDLGACNTEAEVTDLDETVIEWIVENDLPFMEQWAIAVSTRRRGLQKTKATATKGFTKL